MTVALVWNKHSTVHSGQKSYFWRYYSNFLEKKLVLRCPSLLTVYNFGLLVIMYISKSFLIFMVLFSFRRFYDIAAIKSRNAELPLCRSVTEPKIHKNTTMSKRNGWQLNSAWLIVCQYYCISKYDSFVQLIDKVKWIESKLE